VACLSDDDVIALLAGDLPVTSRRSADEHLATCGDCRSIVAETARGLEDRTGERTIEAARDVSQIGEDRAAFDARAQAATIHERMGKARPVVSATPQDQLEPGQLVSRYQIVRPIGAGGAGIVYEAFDPQLGRRIALKMVRPRPGEAATMGAGRLLREARAMARLSHPHVVHVHDAGVFAGQVFVAMEHVDGGTMATWLAQASRSWRDIVQCFLEAGQGLAAAHAAGLIHRDFKPENVLIGNDGRARVTDFGLARAIDLDSAVPAHGAPMSPSSWRGSKELLTLTEAGALAGTPAYMAPEQFQHGRPDERTDQYNFCASLYAALYGQWPCGGSSGQMMTLPELARRVITGEIETPPDSLGVPAAVFAVVRRGLSLSPLDRFGSIAELLAQLTHLLADEAAPPPRPRRLRGLALAALAAVGLVTAGGIARLARSGPRAPVAPVVVAPLPLAPVEVAAIADAPVGVRTTARVSRPIGPAPGTRAARNVSLRPRLPAAPAPAFEPTDATVAPPNRSRYGHRLKDPFGSP
jgi:hypothetical protein